MKSPMLFVSMLLAALLMTAGTTTAQVTVTLSTPVWNYQYSCPPVASSTATIYITETNPSDFWGSQGGGNDRNTYDLYIALPPGWEFIDNPNNPAKWYVRNSANLTKNSTGTLIQYAYYDVDAVLMTKYPGDFDGTPFDALEEDLYPYNGTYSNTIIVKDLECKNTNMTDVLELSNLQIRLIPDLDGPSFIPSGNLWMWTANETGPIPTGRDYVNDIPTLGTTSSSTVIFYNAGPASGIRFMIEPLAGDGDDPSTLHDVQGRIRGTETSTWPTVQAVDCNGYPTTNVPSNAYVDIVDIDPVLPAPPAIYTPNNPSLFWSSSSVGPTYTGAALTTTQYSSWTTIGTSPNQSKVIPLVISMKEAGDYRINATASNITPDVGTPPEVKLSENSENTFFVRQRTVSWANEPVFGSPEYNPMTGNYWIPVENNPSASILDLIGDPILDAMAAMEIRPGNVATLLPPFEVSSFYDATYTPGTVPDYDIYFGNTAKAFELPGSVINQVEKPLFSAYAFVYTEDYQGTKVYDKYLDPRYMYDGTLVDAEALPVELVAFGGQLRNDVVTLKWTTATETNNYGFEVERSFDRAAWTKVGFVQGNGTTSSQHDYRFEDRLAAADLQHAAISYRLRQIDRDGTTEHSQVVTLSVAPTAEKVTMLQNYPNPFNPTTNISFYLPTSDVVTLVVYNELGVEVARVHDNAALDSGWHTTSFRAGSLPSGLYAYRLQTGAGAVARTMVVAK